MSNWKKGQSTKQTPEPGELCHAAPAALLGNETTQTLV